MEKQELIERNAANKQLTELEKLEFGEQVLKTAMLKFRTANSNVFEKGKYTTIDEIVLQEIKELTQKREAIKLEINEKA